MGNDFWFIKNVLNLGFQLFVRHQKQLKVKSVKNWKLTSEFCYLRTEVNNKSNWIHKNNNQPYEIMSKQDRR